MNPLAKVNLLFQFKAEGRIGILAGEGKTPAFNNSFFLEKGTRQKGISCCSPERSIQGGGRVAEYWEEE